MDKPDENLLEVWAEESIQPPIHSRLYPLEPIGLGTPFVESLTSYIQRLAEAHSVSPRVLVSQEISPHLKLSYLGRSLNGKNHADSQVLTAFWRESRTINGITNWAEDWVHTLEMLTLRKDLRFLTMLPWERVLSSTQLVQRTQHWCPLCYEDWSIAGSAIYQPLHWALKDISWCPIHSTLLEQYCPNINCKRKIHFLTSHLQMGYCPWCQCWLGRSRQEYITREISVEDEKAQDYRSIEKVIEKMLSITPDLKISSYKYIIADLAKTATLKEISSCLEIDIDTPIYWRNGRRLPILNNFLRICKFFKVSPIDIITGKVIEDILKSSQIPLNTPAPNQMRKTKVIVDMERDRIALEEALHSPEDSPLSLADVTKKLGYISPAPLRLRFPELCQAVKTHYQNLQSKIKAAELQKLKEALEAVLSLTSDLPSPSLEQVAISLGCTTRHLYRYFPELCRAISERYKAEQKMQRTKRIAGICENVREVAQQLHEQGIYPSIRKVRERLPSSSSTRDPKVRSFWKKTVKELGWS